MCKVSVVQRRCLENTYFLPLPAACLAFKCRLFSDFDLVLLGQDDWSKAEDKSRAKSSGERVIISFGERMEYLAISGQEKNPCFMLPINEMVLEL
jgi:hypothetical protein